MADHGVTVPVGAGRTSRARGCVAALEGFDDDHASAAARHCRQRSQRPHRAGMTRGLHGLRIGIDHAWNTTGIDAATIDVVTAVLATVRDLGADIRDVKFPDVGQMIAGWFPLCGGETAVAHEATYPARKSEYGPALSGLIELGMGLSGLEYQKIILRRAAFRGRVAALFQDIDLLLVPAQGVAPLTPRRWHASARMPGCCRPCCASPVRSI